MKRTTFTTELRTILHRGHTLLVPEAECALCQLEMDEILPLFHHYVADWLKKHKDDPDIETKWRQQIGGKPPG